MHKDIYLTETISQKALNTHKHTSHTLGDICILIVIKCKDCEWVQMTTEGIFGPRVPTS